MATRIVLKHKETGLLKDGYFGFSWTTLFFGFFPALFRGDFVTFIGGFLILFIVALATAGIGAFFVGFVWAFMYNKYYTRRMLERGYSFAGSEGENAQAAIAVGVALPLVSSAV